MDDYMQSALLVNNDYMFNVGLSEILRNVIMDIRVDVTIGEDGMEMMLAQEQYQLCIYGMAIVDQKDLDKLYLLVNRFPSMAIVLLFENLGFLPIQKIYRAGIKGILHKCASKAEFVMAINAIKKSGFYINSNLLVPMLPINRWKEIAPFDLLTKKENTVVDLLLEGKGNLEICSLLKLRPSTISTFKKIIFRKLAVNNLFELQSLKKESESAA